MSDDETDSAADDDDVAELDRPLCDVCGTPLEASGTDAHPYWLCPRCSEMRTP